MSITGKSKSFNLPQSSFAKPATFKISKVYCGSTKNLNLIRKSLDKVRVTKRFSTVFKGYDKELEKKPELGPELKENFLEAFKISEYNSEKVLKEFREKLLNEKSPEGKFFVFSQFCGKIAKFSKLFQEVFSIFSEDFDGINQGLSLVVKLKNTENQIKYLQEKCENLEKDLKKSTEAGQQFSRELEKIVDEDIVLRATCRKQSSVLNSLKKSGFPVEEYFNGLKSQKKAKSLTHSYQENNPKSSTKLNSPLPQLIFPNTSAFKSYQEEFMSKFSEFSESWREEMQKAHPYLKT